MVARIRARWPEVKITVRGDAGFCRDQIMRWCEDNGIWYVLGLSRNPRLQRKIRRQMSKAGSRCVMLGKASRRFRDFRYRTLAGWSCKRRVVAKAEWLPGPRGYNSRFVVTNIPKVTIRAKPLYEDLYCARGEMENRIREQQLDLFADRTSATTMRTNQLRACFSAFAGVLMQIIRELIEAQYPLVIFDPHGDYLGLWQNREHLPPTDVKLFYPSLRVTEQNRALVTYLVSQMSQGFTDAQREFYHDALEHVTIGEREMSVQVFIDRVLQKLDGMSGRHPGTIPAIRRSLRIVRGQLDAMDVSNSRLRNRAALEAFPFEPMPDPVTDAVNFARPGQVSVIYLGGYDHLTQSTVVAIVLKHLFEHRASLDNVIPPFLAVVEEAHNFIPSRGEGQSETPSVEVIRKVITEGRKFGTGLLLISQRPSRLDETSLSQCNIFLILRLVNPRDQAFVEKVLENLSRADSRLLPGFGPGQGIVSGQAVRFPLVIKVRYDQELESESLGREDLISQAQRWTGSAEAEAARTSEKFIKELDAAQIVDPDPTSRL